MKLRLQALSSLRWNCKLGGVWVWLTGLHHCPKCLGLGWYDSTHGPIICSDACHGTGWLRGYQRILSEPQRVLDEQAAIAEGVFV